MSNLFNNLIHQILLAIIVILTSFTIFSCAHKRDWASRVTWEQVDFDHIPDQEEYPDAGAVVLLDEGRMEIGGSAPIGFSVFERHRIIKIFNTRGHRYANVSIPYNSQSQVDRIQARTISAEGDITVLDEKDIYDVTFYPNFIFYSDQRAKIFTIPAVANGSIIEFRYRLNVWSRTFWHAWRFQDDVPTVLSRFTLVEPSEWKVNYRIYRIDIESGIEKAPAGFKSVYTWEAQNIPALKTEFGMPPRNKTTARLALAPVWIQTWEDVTKWYHDLSEPQTKAGYQIKKLASTLTVGTNNNKEKLKIIYEWVRDRIRYIAVEIGIGGYKPHAAEKVLVNRYGDCKDMTTLLCSIAHEAGINVYPVLISTLQNGLPDTSLPSQLHFNHLIAYCPTVGANGFWMDATEKGCPFGRLPWYDQGLPVLIVGKNGKAKILTTPLVPADSNSTVMDWCVNLDFSGEAIVQGKTYLRGAQASELREDFYFTSPDSRRQWLETYLAKRCSGAKLDSFNITGLDSVYDPLMISYTFRTATFCVPHSDRLIFRPGLFSAFDLPDYFRSPERTYPVQFSFGSLKEMKLTINMPTNFSVVTPSVSDSLLSEFGSACWSYSVDGNVLKIDTRYRMDGNNINPECYKDFCDFLDNIREKDLREVVLGRLRM